VGNAHPTTASSGPLRKKHFFAAKDAKDAKNAKEIFIIILSKTNGW